MAREYSESMIMDDEPLLFQKLVNAKGTRLGMGWEFVVMEDPASAW
jgi:hypothetical protein